MKSSLQLCALFHIFEVFKFVLLHLAANKFFFFFVLIGRKINQSQKVNIEIHNVSRISGGRGIATNGGEKNVCKD